MKKVFVFIASVLVIVNITFVAEKSQRMNKFDIWTLANIESLARNESGGSYKKCYTGTKIASGTSSLGIIALYCGDCLSARIWPTGDGECRRY